VLAGVAAGLVVLAGLAVAAAVFLGATREVLEARAPAPDPAVRGCGTTAATGPLPAALTGVPAAGRPVVTPDGARAALAAIWPLREAALSACDVGAIDVLETGFARAGDRVRVTCGCRVRAAPAEFTGADLYVPRRTRFPAYFLAEVVTTNAAGEAWTEDLVLSRSAAADHWRVAFDTGYTNPAPGGHSDAPALDADGYVRTPPAAAAAAAREDFAALAAYWHRAKVAADTALPSEFAAGYWTSRLAEVLAAHPSGGVQDNGLIGDFAYRTRSRDPVYAFTTASGRTLACSGIHRAVTYRASAAGAPYQDRARRNWGADIAPGTYRTLSGDGVSQTCLSIPPAGNGIGVFGGDEPAETRLVGRR
jgi:hypothetical protein